MGKGSEGSSGFGAESEPMGGGEPYDCLLSLRGGTYVPFFSLADYSSSLKM